MIDGKLTSDPHYFHLNSGFVPGKIYELVYTAKNPRSGGSWAGRGARLSLLFEI